MTNTTLSEALEVAPFTDAEREEFFKHYAICALWSTTQEDGRPLDDDADVDDIAPETAKDMRETCDDFIDANLALLRRGGQAIEQMGHDFWLTRNGHGAGFWDRGLGDVGTQLTSAAKVYGSQDLFLDADGKVQGN